ncbi:MAG: hypothetical protein JXA53_09690 [Bacteroidales bacterium]|nr:hypothetical protein [Bacteroidales bacterium]
MYKRAIVRIPPNPTNGQHNDIITTTEIIKQHNNLVSALTSINVYVTILPSNNDIPTSHFIENNVLFVNKRCILLNSFNPKENNREQFLEDYFCENFDVIGKIQLPAKVEGGDILKINDTFYIAIGGQTNEMGYLALKKIIENEGFNVKKIINNSSLYLKSQISYIGQNILLVSDEMSKAPEFSNYRKIILPKEERFAANTFVNGGFVFMPKSAQKSIQIVKRANFLVKEIEISEFIKQDKGLSSLVIFY